MDNIKISIQKKNAVIGIVGLGYVGLPIAVESALVGFTVIGFEINKEKVSQINNGKNYIQDIDDSSFKKVVSEKKLKATTEYEELGKCDIIIICVPTPLDKYYQPDTQYIVDAGESIHKFRKKPSLIILESTTYPGTTEEILLPILEKDGSKLGKDLFLSFSPERVDPGNAKYKTKNIPKVVGGCTKECNELSKLFYSTILTGGVFEVSSPKVAEMEKLLENTFRLVNIGLVNEMALLADKMNINIWEVIEAAKTKPYGFMPFYPGPGLGGHCIPIDPYYLSWKAKEFHFQTSLIDIAGQTNVKMPEYVVNKIGIILNKNKKYFSGSKIAMLGIAYKKNIDDYRESPALRILQLLQKLNCEVILVDPFVTKFKGLDGKIYKTTQLSAELLETADLTLIITDHSSFDIDLILEKSKIIYDTRNLIKKNHEKVISL